VAGGGMVVVAFAGPAIPAVIVIGGGAALVTLALGGYAIYRGRRPDPSPSFPSALPSPPPMPALDAVIPTCIDQNG
jgi:hypothetical protein